MTSPSPWYSFVTSPLYDDLLAHVRAQRTPVSTYGVPESARAFLLALLHRDGVAPILLLTANPAAAARYHEDFLNLGLRSALFPAREVTFYRTAAASGDVQTRRLHALRQARTGIDVVVAPIDALLTPLMPVDMFDGATTSLAVGDTIEPQAFLERLIHAGYERVDTVEGRGQVSLRGGILDLFPVGMNNACRIEFYDDEVDTIREFDTLTQRSTGTLERIEACPAVEALLDADAARHAHARLTEELRAIEAKYGVTRSGMRMRSVGADDDEDEDALPSLWEMEEIRPAAEVNEPAERLAARLRELLDHLAAIEHTSDLEAFLPLLYEKPASLLEYLQPGLIALDDPSHLRERCANVALEFGDMLTDALERLDALPGQSRWMAPYDDVLRRCLARPVMTVQSLALQSSDVSPRAQLTFDMRAMASYHGQIPALVGDIKRRQGHRVVLLAGGVARGQRLSQTLTEHGVSAQFIAQAQGEAGARDASQAQPGPSAAGKGAAKAPRATGQERSPGDAPLPAHWVEGAIAVLPNNITHGFEWPEARLWVASEQDLFGVSKKRATKKKVAGRLAAFTDLSPGDYVVHESHGVGVYQGTIRQLVDGASKDFMHIKYVDGALYIPTDQMDRVQKYIGGGEDASPKLNRLGGGEWDRAKKRTKESIKAMAIDLMQLYAQRQAAKGHAYPPDTPWQREFEESFPYEETPDQLACIEDIKRDMEKTAVMDRLLCGDVGYGKTEVALRAAFKAVMDSKQVAVLVPTTILAQQHFQTMKKRFDGFPITVDVLSRFRTPAEQKKVVEGARSGKIDIVVGTHRLLNKDMRFKDLGLLVIDEEQRFGVAHKEKLKEMRKNIDVLTLSATPIPRTLHMSMVGIRDLSTIETPPEERYPVQTYVVEYNESLIRDAILREIGRGGQVYFVYNRVETIDKFHAELRDLVPEARIAVGHGQMKETSLEDVMLDYYEGKYDVLLCTTIIETGLDIPAANTLIVYDADRFGLSTLYQLRGRVGRSNRLAYAYLTVHRDKALSETAEKRLSAIREFTELGAGFKVAMRDLEIRGAGNLLGAEQSGHLSSVGYELYCKMIEETIRQIKGELGEVSVDCIVDIRLDAFLPAEYVVGDAVRVEVYQRIASIRSQEDREDVLEELIDRFGEPPQPVCHLVDIAHLKAACEKLYIEWVGMKNERLTMRFSSQATWEASELVRALGVGDTKLMLTSGTHTGLVLRVAAEVEELVLRGTDELEALHRELMAGRKVANLA